MPRIPDTSHRQTLFLRALLKHPDGPPPQLWPSPIILRRWLRRPGFLAALESLRDALRFQSDLHLAYAAHAAARAMHHPAPPPDDVRATHASPSSHSPNCVGHAPPSLASPNAPSNSDYAGTTPATSTTAPQDAKAKSPAQLRLDLLKLSHLRQRFTKPSSARRSRRDPLAFLRRMSRAITLGEALDFNDGLPDPDPDPQDS